MNELIKQKWVEALTSGEYSQGKSCLNNGQGGFCCLGVLTDIYAKEHGLEWEFIEDEGKPGFDGEVYLTPLDVQAWSGIDTNVPYLPFAERANFIGKDPEPIPEADISTSIAALNDEGITFPQIADLIKAFL
jgi:hypothetical protein